MITAYFDGYCVICQSTRKIIKKLDWFDRVLFVDLHDQALLAEQRVSLDYDAMMGEIHVQTDHHMYRGFAGTRRMLKELPLGWPVWAILHLPGMMWVGSRFYAWVARNRYAVNRFFGVELDPCIDGVCKLPE